MIITQQKNNEISVGTIVVNDLENLFLICESLLKDNGVLLNYVTKKKKNFIDVNFILGDKPIREGNQLSYYNATNICGDGTCEIEAEVVQCLHLNSILLFISLLGNTDVVNCSKYAKDFLKSGIIYYAPFEQIWNVCSRNMVKEFKILKELEAENPESKAIESRLKQSDLSIFKFALDNGIISYCAKTYDASSTCLFDSFDIKDLQQVADNNMILLGDAYSSKKVKSRKNS